MLGRRALEAYAAKLRTHPYSTNSASALVVCGSGDVVAQPASERYDRDGGAVDARRTATVARSPGGARAGWGRPASSGTGGWRGAAAASRPRSRRTRSSSRRRRTRCFTFKYTDSEALKRDASPLAGRYAARGPTMCVSVLAWVPAQALNLSRVPLPHRPLFLNACFVLWTAFLSHRGHRDYG